MSAVVDAIAVAITVKIFLHPHDALGIDSNRPSKGDPVRKPNALQNIEGCTKFIADLVTYPGQCQSSLISSIEYKSAMGLLYNSALPLIAILVQKIVTRKDSTGGRLSVLIFFTLSSCRHFQCVECVECVECVKCGPRLQSLFSEVM